MARAPRGRPGPAGPGPAGSRRRRASDHPQAHKTCADSPGLCRWQHQDGRRTRAFGGLLAAELRGSAVSESMSPYRNPTNFAMTGLAAMSNKRKNLLTIFVLVSLSPVYAFMSPSKVVYLNRGQTRINSAKFRRGSLIRAVAAESLQDNIDRALVDSSVKDGKNVLWKDASPQRTLDKKQISWINQFPNTWQPAEKLLLSKDVRYHQGKETISTAGTS